MSATDRFGTELALPRSLRPLLDLARNLWWIWDAQAGYIFRDVDPARWDEVYHNPLALLAAVNEHRLCALAANEKFCEALRKIHARFRAYMDTGADASVHDFEGRRVAYFSAEFGIHESLSLYSGGLGILSGDHLKAASDLGLPLVGVGLAYRFGYFHQQIDLDGRQHEDYRPNNFSLMPMALQCGDDGEPLVVSLPYPGRTVRAQIWKIDVGRIPLYLLDTDVNGNDEEDRAISNHLYGGDEDTRVRQEILLGVGGLRALTAVGIEPDVCHLNEGHSAFLTIEQIRRLMTGQGLDLANACTAARARNIFTTHTPVPAGNDAFDRDHVREYLRPHAEEMGIDVDALVNLGLMDPADGREKFGMTVLALRLSRFANGVSELHGAVAREMWHFLWPGSDLNNVPIKHVTNGVHMPTWIADEMDPLYRRHLADDPPTLPHDVFWAEHERRRGHLVQMVRERLIWQGRREHAPPEYMETVSRSLDPRALTIGFARRFAPYKRATLMLRDPARLARILGAPGRPVQIIIAGKAHPRNEPGKELMQKVWSMSRRPEFHGRLVLVEGYDIDLARHLVQGCDIWLNTPRRPLEASGTSGMKAAANGALNLSVLDGWWCEGYEENNGWAIGNGKNYDDPERQDDDDAESLYTLLEEQIVPLFYARAAGGLPQAWVQRMIEAVEAVIPQFSTVRMVDEYTERFYLPCALDVKLPAGG
ncbi:alpha-glucan family phosphorylase [bacterium]|nr:alpha-glucan family phosphorylase [bacterium]MBU1073301.1 alpha-glucan family phosphorylase [bacterium]MBU1676122.1 alpha-glucan family phosphorylase [bacterium]